MFHSYSIQIYIIICDSFYYLSLVIVTRLSLHLTTIFLKLIPLTVLIYSQTLVTIIHIVKCITNYNLLTLG